MAPRLPDSPRDKAGKPPTVAHLTTHRGTPGTLPAAPACVRTRSARLRSAAIRPHRTPEGETPGSARSVSSPIAASQQRTRAARSGRRARSWRQRNPSCRAPSAGSTYPGRRLPGSRSRHRECHCRRDSGEMHRRSGLGGRATLKPRSENERGWRDPDRHAPVPR